jgi:hypothetical protein
MGCSEMLLSHLSDSVVSSGCLLANTVEDCSAFIFVVKQSITVGAEGGQSILHGCTAR